MSGRTWAIIGATSIIAEKFAHCAAESGNSLLLVGRCLPQLKVIAADIALRYQVHCDVISADFNHDIHQLIRILEHTKNLDLFIAHSMMMDNNKLTHKTIAELLNVNVVNTVQLIHAYWNKQQTEHRVLFLSSVAACRGRAKNSLYGASKATIELYLEGLQQAATNSQHITIARLGYIDTHMTYAQTGIFYASPPKACAKACWRAIMSNKRHLYHPFFWRHIMALITHLPFFIYKKMNNQKTRSLLL